MSKLIVDAQLLLNIHRMYHGIMEHYYGVTRDLAKALEEQAQQGPSTFDACYKTMNDSLRKSIALHKKASLRLENSFLGFKKDTQHPSSVEHGIGLTLPLSDYGLVLKDQQKAYKSLTEHASHMKYLLYMMLMDDHATNKGCVEKIYLLEGSLSVLLLLAENVVKILEMIEGYVLNHLQEKAEEAFINGMEFFKYLEGQAEGSVAADANTNPPPDNP
jgi:hypothetical protein